MWWSGRCGWPLVHLVARPYLVRRLLATGWLGQVMRQLAVEPRGGPRASAGSLVGRAGFGGGRLQGQGSRM